MVVEEVLVVEATDDIAAAVVTKVVEAVHQIVVDAVVAEPTVELVVAS